MSVQQISVFLENKSGRLADVTRILSDANINLRAMTIADTADFGILRILSDKVDKALEVLEKGGFTAKVTEVLGIEVEDKPGGLAKVMDIFDKNDVNIEYLYVTLERNQDKAVVIFKVEDIAYGQSIIERNNLSSISGF